jgi:hypothetical protein
MTERQKADEHARRLAVMADDSGVAATEEPEKNRHLFASHLAVGPRKPGDERATVLEVGGAVAFATRGGLLPAQAGDELAAAGWPVDAIAKRFRFSLDRSWSRDENDAFTPERMRDIRRSAQEWLTRNGG